jgi:hypothetical protein
MTISIKNILATLIVVLSIISVNQWSSFPIGNTYTNWIIYTIITILFLKGIKHYYDDKNSKNLLFVKLYLIWIIICFVRGIFESQHYWDFKNLIQSSLALLIAVCIYLFTNPVVIQVILSKWLIYALPLFSLFIFLLPTDSYGYYLVPISFFTLFLPSLSNKLKILVLIISFFVIIIDFDARSNVIKFTIPILLSLLFYYKRLVNLKLLKIIFMSCFALPFVFLFLSALSIFNIFQMEDYIKGEYIQKKIVFGQKQELNLKADTRTGLYKEVIISAIKNNYILLGRTPARGYDSESFGIYLAEDLNTNRYERYSNEVSILNIFSWTGIIGVVLYFLIFFRAVYFAIYKSNNFFLKVIGLYVTFRWIYAWVEDFNRFDIMNIVLWIFISICYSEQFRSMSDNDFKEWLISIFNKKKNIKIRKWKSE